ncbi:hypothetical protein DSM106972_049520 [Dulcicalothrix desertica PCC 7102]|uniref:Uncharacterized protein n=1 Tax=Dulcicalothrix desertica PCC 7102 TaxID=232991 RepID=A0A3S1B3F9_9CYAN|nr:DUF6753 family protein [Dulcicalothrix desertica]RUT04038.1 hypothetical protein DSM106972_049520 [Dulcicalothrix desertica PCC 7102]TWH43559.1 hypothetical protein CAL7102_07292 [Dulcicalothrix desertica PCC 7102]
MVHSLRQAKTENFLNRLLEGKDADFQRRVLAITVEHGLSTNDPLFLVMLATGQLQVLLEDKPNELDNLFKRWSESIYDQLEKAKRTATSGQEIEIRKMVDRLIKHSESKERSRLKVMIPALGILSSAIGFGVLAGLAVPVWLAGGYAPVKPRKLTVAEVETLQWSNSSEGKLARHIMTWNSESLTNLNCTKVNAQRIIAAKEKRGAGDYCLLRVKAP